MARSSELIQIIKDKETVCMLCKQSTDDPEELGEKLQHENITVHFFCLVQYNFHVRCKKSHSFAQMSF